MLEFLEARDRRQETLEAQLANRYPALLFFTLNIPGGDKTPPGAFGLYNHGLETLFNAFPGMRLLVQGSDQLGPYTYFRLDRDPGEVKRACVELESAGPHARLYDLDVYDSQGRQLDRAAIGLAPRSCLLCENQAVECIRLKRHSIEEVTDKAHELLAPFRY